MCIYMLHLQQCNVRCCFTIRAYWQMSKYPCMTHLILVNVSMINYTKNKDCSYYYQKPYCHIGLMIFLPYLFIFIFHIKIISCKSTLWNESIGWVCDGRKWCYCEMLFTKFCRGFSRNYFMVIGWDDIHQKV